MIEVGEYVRIKGVIGKIENINNFREPSMKYALDIPQARDLVFVGEKEIVKHSKNIIDLIEVKDIVEIYDVLNEDVIYIWNEEMLKAVKEDVNNGIGIRRILTKEQYEANCYKVKEEIC